MFKKKESYRRRSSFLPFVIFRMVLSLTILGVLALGVYSAYKQFSGMDPLKIDPKALVLNVISSYSAFIPAQILEKIPLEKFEGKDQVMGEQKVVPAPKKPNVSFRFLLIADSHSDNETLKKGIDQAKAKYPDLKFTIGLGDYTEVGTLSELTDAKKVFDESSLRYFLTAGDHDLWDARNKQEESILNFSTVFGSPFQSFTYGDVGLLLIYNSDNYHGLGQDQLNWLYSELDRLKQQSKLILTFTHEPLYHPSSVRVMGKSEESLKDEAKKLSKLFKDSGVREVFAGDIHYFTRYSEPETDLAMTTIGAVTADRNPQNPRYAVVTVFDDLSYEVEDAEVK